MRERCQGVGEQATVFVSLNRARCPVCGRVCAVRDTGVVAVHWVDERLERARELSAAGATHRAIARELGLSSQRVSQLLADPSS